MNSLARSNASLYGNKEELYDRLRRHAYQGGKKGEKNFSLNSILRKTKIFSFINSLLIFPRQQEQQRDYQ